MEKISISNIVEFRRKSLKSQITFIKNLKLIKLKSKPDEGGNYWVRSLSTIGSVFKSEQNELLKEKIELLREKHSNSEAEISKVMFQRNIKILSDFEGFKFSRLKPNFELNYLSKPKNKSILTIKSVSIQVLPQHVFTFKEKNVEKIGAIWFVAKLGGFKKEELALFTDALYRYLKCNYSRKYEIDTNYCLSIDTMTLKELSYSKILKNEVQSTLSSTLDLIKKLL